MYNGVEELMTRYEEYAREATPETVNTGVNWEKAMLYATLAQAAATAALVRTNEQITNAIRGAALRSHG